MRTRSVRLALVLSTLAFAGCGNDITGPSVSPVSISGAVLDYRSRKPIASGAIEFKRSIDSMPSATATIDQSGRYTATLPEGGRYYVYVDNRQQGMVYVGGERYLGDLLIDNTGCIARYGTVTDAAGKPIGGATVVLGQPVVSRSDGWYITELGCPAVNPPGGTTLMYVSRAGYAPWQQVVGRGVGNVLRLDAALEKPKD